VKGVTKVGLTWVRVSVCTSSSPWKRGLGRQRCSHNISFSSWGL